MFNFNIWEMHIQLQLRWAPMLKKIGRNTGFLSNIDFYNSEVDE